MNNLQYWCLCARVPPLSVAIEIMPIITESVNKMTFFCGYQSPLSLAASFVSFSSCAIFEWVLFTNNGEYKNRKKTLQKHWMHDREKQEKLFKNSKCNLLMCWIWIWLTLFLLLLAIASWMLEFAGQKRWQMFTCTRQPSSFIMCPYKIFMHIIRALFYTNDDRQRMLLLPPWMMMLLIWYFVDFVFLCKLSLSCHALTIQQQKMFLREIGRPKSWAVLVMTIRRGAMNINEKNMAEKHRIIIICWFGLIL